MEDLFRDYWWLMFPLFGFAFGGWSRFLAYRSQRDHIELLKTYAASGREPPPEVVPVSVGSTPSAHASSSRKTVAFKVACV